MARIPIFLSPFRSECVPFRDNGAERRARRRAKGQAAPERRRRRRPFTLQLLECGCAARNQISVSNRARGLTEIPLTRTHSAPSLPTSSAFAVLQPLWTTRNNSLKAETDYCTVRVPEYGNENTVLTKFIMALDGTDLTKICQISVNNISLKS